MVARITTIEMVETGRAEIQEDSKSFFLWNETIILIEGKKGGLDERRFNERFIGNGEIHGFLSLPNSIPKTPSKKKTIRRPSSR